MRGDRSKGQGENFKAHSNLESYDQAFLEARGKHFGAITALNRDIHSKKEKGKLPKDEKGRAELAVRFSITDQLERLLDNPGHSEDFTGEGDGWRAIARLSIPEVLRKLATDIEKGSK